MTPVALDASEARPRAAWLRRLTRAPLAAKLAFAFLGLVAFVLIVNGAIDTWLTYNQAKRAALEVEQEKARSAAERVGAFLTDIQSQLGWTTGAEWGYAKLEQQRYDFIRLLRQTPAITALSYIDGHGKEQIAVSRLEPDSIGSAKDFSNDPRFVRAVADKIWFGPVEFRRGSEPYMTISLAHVGKTPGVTVADVNLKLVWDVVSAIHVGEKGFAYVVDDHGRLIAHPDLSLVLRDTDFSRLPQVGAALAGQRSDEMPASQVGSAEVAMSLDGSPVLTGYAIAPKTHWAVFVEQPLAEALATAYRSLARSLALLCLGLVLAAVSGVVLARRMAAPIRLLQVGAEKLGAGDLGQRLDIRTGDEIEALAGSFNRMAGSLQESYETLEAKVEARTKDLNEALQQQTATADVLKVISRSAFDLEAVLNALVASAVRLSGAGEGVICVREGEVLRLRAGTWVEDTRQKLLGAEVPATSNTVVGRVLLSHQVEEIEDVRDVPDYHFPIIDWPARLGVPMLRNKELVGVFVLMRGDPGRFPNRVIELVQTFADQAVIAIENARLFDEVQARTRDLEESLAQQTATADVLKAISRSAFDLDVVLDTLISTAMRLCDATHGQIFRRHGDVYRYAASQMDVSPAYREHEQAVEIRPGRGTLIGRVALAKQAVRIEDALNDPEYVEKEEARVGNVRSMLGVPLMRNGEPIGAFALARPTPVPFTPRQVELVATFADQAVIAIENVRLFDEVQARTRDLEESLERQTATSKILEVIASSPADASPVFDAIAASANAVMHGHSTTVFRIIEDRAYLMAFTPTSPEADAALRASFPVPVVEFSPFVYVNDGQTFQVADTEADDDPRIHDIGRARGFRSMIFTPLVHQGRTIGVIAVTRKTPGSFAAADVAQLRAFADQAVIAIQNARLFEEVQARTREVEEALAQQTATADVLKVISRSPSDLAPVLDAIAETAARLCGSDMTMFFRFDGEAFRILQSWNFPEDVRAMLETKAPAPGHPSALGRAGASLKPAYIPDVLADPDYGLKSEQDRAHYRATLAVPMLREGKLVGALSLNRNEPGSFTPKHIELVSTFADQAAIAFENVRLFEEVRARTRDLEESLAQQTATADVLKVISRSAFDLDTVFQTLVTSAVDLCKASSGTLCVRDGEVFRYRGMAGPEASADLQGFLAAHPLVAPTRSTIAGRTILSGQAEEIRDVLQEKDYAVPFASLSSPARGLLGVPLLGKSEVQGAIVVARAEPGAFPPRHVEILRTFADQAVIAIENARLFEQVQSRTRELQASLDDLRKAQDRLVQSEKLASLGQLTAGIAHEIKNPLNFVNNFSSLSRELLAEMRDTLEGASLETNQRADVDELIGMLDSNLDKVVHHGKRADSIVKNMLLHSREGSGERSEVDVNHLVEEALNLAYHGARAEKPGFNVRIDRQLDPAAGTIEGYHQELTRVLLNLAGNGFYATHKREASEAGDYEPTVLALTRDLGDTVEIVVRDNGTGVPPDVKAKMFNPFFTTKPAGEGTGLGLSLSHDIVVKQHGGAIEVDSELGSFTEITIRLPRRPVAAPAVAVAAQ